MYLAVRGSGALVWRLLAESTTRDSFVEALVEKYGIDATQATADVDAFLSTLNDRGLLMARAPGDPASAGSALPGGHIALCAMRAAT